MQHAVLLHEPDNPMIKEYVSVLKEKVALDAGMSVI